MGSYRDQMLRMLESMVPDDETPEGEGHHVEIHLKSGHTIYGCLDQLQAEGDKTVAVYVHQKRPGRWTLIDVNEIVAVSWHSGIAD